MKYIRFSCLLCISSGTMILQTTHQFLHDNIVSPVSLLNSTKTTHVNTSTFKYTKVCTVVSTKSTSYTPQLFSIICLFATVFVHVAFKCSSRSTSERIKEFSITTIVIHVDNNPPLSLHLSFALIHILQFTRENVATLPCEILMSENSDNLKHVQ